MNRNVRPQSGGIVERENASTERWWQGAAEAPSGPVLRLQVTLFQYGRQRAIDSGVTKPRDTDIIALREHAAAMARETRRELFDPEKNPEHRLREHEYNKLQADRPEAEEGVKHAAARVREKEAILANIPNEPQPHEHVLIAVLIAGIAGTVTPTVHDVIFAGLDDDLIAWCFSFCGAGFVAAVVVWAILGSASSTGRRTVLNWLGLFAGMAVSLGLGLFRLSGAMGVEEVILAVGLTVLEIGMVVLAEYVASGLRDHFQEWTARRAVRTAAEAEVGAAQAERDRRASLLDEINKSIWMHIEYVEDLSLRSMNLQELIEVAIKSITDGYHDGVAYNRGRVVKAEGVR